MSPLINLVWRFVLGFFLRRGRLRGEGTEEEFKRMRQVLNFRTTLVGEENSPPLITLSIAPLFVSLSTAYLYLYIVWLMCSGPGASEEM